MEAKSRYHSNVLPLLIRANRLKKISEMPALSGEQKFKAKNAYARAQLDYLLNRFYFTIFRFPGSLLVSRREISSIIDLAVSVDLPRSWAVSSPFESFFREKSKHRANWSRLEAKLSAMPFYSKSVEAINSILTKQVSKIIVECGTFSASIAAQMQRTGRPTPEQAKFLIGSILKTLRLKKELFSRAIVLGHSVENVAKKEGFPETFIAELVSFQQEIISARKREEEDAMNWREYLNLFEPGNFSA